MKDNNSSSSSRDNYNSNTHQNKYHNQQGSHNERRKHHQQQQNPNQYQNQQQHHQQQHQQQQQQQQQQQPQQFHHSNQRERSGQRNLGGQYPDSSMGRDNNNPMTNIQGLNQSNLGSIRFQPGFPTRELPPIETKPDPAKKFAGRCRLFIGNLPHNTTEEKLRTLFETYGEVGEVFLGPKSAFAFIKMDTRQTAEAARDALDCTTYEGRTLRVRLAAHAAAIRIKHISSQVTNELLAYAFRYFGEIERAVVVVDDKGKSIGEGVVEYSKKQSALYAIKRCQQECFMLTASHKPVLVEPFDQQDEDEGLPEKSVNKNLKDYKEQREIGPRFAEQGTFEQTFALKWKDLYDVEKQKRDRLEQEIQDARRNLEDQIEQTRLEHETIQLKNRLQQLEDDRLKLQQMKEASMTGAQRRDDQRHQQDMLIRQREDDILHRQQMGGDHNGLNHQENTLRMQANTLQDILSNQERQHSDDSNNNSNQQQSHQQKNLSQSETHTNTEVDSSIPITTSQMNLMGPPPIPNQPLAARSFADAAMMALNHQNQQPFIPVSQQQMGMVPPNQQNLFTAFIPQHQMRVNQMQLGVSDNQNYVQQPPPYGMMSQTQPPMSGASGSGGRPKFNKQFNNVNNKGTSSNNVVLTTGGRTRKRGRFQS